MAWPWNLRLGLFKIIENGAVRRTFLVVRHCNYSYSLYRLRVIWHWRIWLDFDLTYCRGDADARTGTSRGCSTQNDVESFLLLDECRCHVVCSRPSPSQSISSWVSLVFLSLAHILGVPVLHIWYDPFFAHDQNTAFGVVVCDLLRPRVDKPYHTPLYSWCCLCELLLQFSSSRTFQIPVICFPVQTE